MDALIAEMPEWARALFWALTALIGAGIFVVGKRGPPKSDGQGTAAFELKAAMVDNRSVDKLSGEVAGQSIAIMEQTKAIKEQTSAVWQLVKVVRAYIDAQEEERERLAERERDRLEREVEELRRERANRERTHPPIDMMRRD